jgi:hypothetical protein
MRDYIDHAMRDAGRIELRHQDGDRWISGLFDDADALRMEIGRRSDRGNLFTTINAPVLMPTSNAMHDRALGDADIALHTRIVFDFDPVRPKGLPSTDVEMGAALSARDRLAAALSSCGWPQPAMAMSGNGAHALYRCRLKASPELTEMLTLMYRGMQGDFSTDDVDFDVTVRNPARIWRLYGTTNRKGSPTLDRPHRVAQIAIPGRWEAVSPQQVERLADMYENRGAPQQDRHRAPVRVEGSGAYATLDAAAWFKAHDSYRRRVERDMHAVRCPWETEHSNLDSDHSTSTVVWEAIDRCWPNFRCLHAHCDGRGIRDVMSLWGDADDHCATAWRAAR